MCAEGYAGNLCAVCASGQGLTLVHFSAQLKHFLLGRGCIQRLFEGCSGDFSGYCGVCRVYIVSETAKVQLGSGRVKAPAGGYAHPTLGGRTPPTCAKCTPGAVGAVVGRCNLTLSNPR